MIFSIVTGANADFWTIYSQFSGRCTLQKIPSVALVSSSHILPEDRWFGKNAQKVSLQRTNPDSPHLNNMYLPK